MPIMVPLAQDHIESNGEVDWSESPVYTGSTNFEPLPETKNILVTGGAGFIACWLVRHLSLTYGHAYRVVCFDKLDYCASLNNTRCLENQKTFVFCYGDITNPPEVMRCLRRYNIDTIFHFAAQSHVDLSFGNSYQFTHTNVYGTHVLLESARDFGIKRFIHISTDEVYGEVPMDDKDLLENSLLAPTNPYAASKAAAEMLVNAYSKSFKLPVIIVRSNNVYGPHQYPEKIIPKFTCLLDRKAPLLLHGDGTNTRRYLYAGDAADAFDTILHKGRIGEIYNVGSYDEFSNADICLKLLAHFGIPEASAGSWIQHTKDRPFNDRRYAVDGTKLRDLGWEQKTSFADGLQITVDWYRKFGKTWWGNIDSVLTPFPVVHDGEVFADGKPEKQQQYHHHYHQVFAETQPRASYLNGGSKKRTLDEEDKHGEGVDHAEAKKPCAMFNGRTENGVSLAANPAP